MWCRLILCCCLNLWLQRERQNTQSEWTQKHSVGVPPDLLCIEASIFICRFPLGPSGEGHICALGHALHDDKAKQHLQRVLNIRFGNESIPDLTVWWYNTQLYLQDTRFKHKMSFQELLHRCYRFSVYTGYDFDIFRGVYRDYNSQNLEEPLAAAQLFCTNTQFVGVRDLGCQYLGTSIHEVLQTLICAMAAGSKFCPDMCGCAEDDLDRESP